MLAITAVVASIVVSCDRQEAEPLPTGDLPQQVVNNMFAVESENGVIKDRMEAPVMERYTNDTASFEKFPEGLQVFGYNEEGALETLVISDGAIHFTPRNRRYSETWSAFGNVVIHNVINRQTMETDTIYWDETLKEIYTDCYVKMYSPDGFMQGYGMRSDDHARQAILLKPFNSYGYAEQDTTVVFVDSVNFIGPFPKK